VQLNITAETPESLRAAMVDQILRAGHAQSFAVEKAMRTMPRHRFVPSASLVEAYADIAVITKRAPDGAALSCASVPPADVAG
jgi:protein-L-isoaspartate(D-aspartate) O-methyltransferase